MNTRLGLQPFQKEALGREVLAVSSCSWAFVTAAHPASLWPLTHSDHFFSLIYIAVINVFWMRVTVNTLFAR